MSSHASNVELGTSFGSGGTSFGGGGFSFTGGVVPPSRQRTVIHIGNNNDDGGSVATDSSREDFGQNGNSSDSDSDSSSEGGSVGSGAEALPTPADSTRLPSTTTPIPIRTRSPVPLGSSTGSGGTSSTTQQNNLMGLLRSNSARVSTGAPKLQVHKQKPSPKGGCCACLCFGRKSKRNTNEEELSEPLVG